jgi:hypothetical protein
MIQLLGKTGLVAFATRFGFTLGSRTVLQVAGSTTYTPPNGCQLLLVEAVGGGGGGQIAVAASAAQLTAGVGANAGSYVAAVIWANTSRKGYTAVVGAGGGVSGTTGGVSTLSPIDSGSGAIVSAAGGTGGNSFTAMTTGTAETLIRAFSPSTGIGQVNLQDTCGGIAHRVSGTVGRSGAGGNGPWGGGGLPLIAQGVGNAGLKYGAGGSGGLSVNGGGAANGGAGAAGLIIIWEFF